MEFVSAKLRGRARAKPYTSEVAFSQLFDSTHLIVFRYVYGVLGGPRQEVEDVTAETFLKAWRARDHFEGDREAAIRWLLAIARNEIVDRLRTRQRGADMVWLEDVELANSDLSPEQQLIENERWQQLQAIVQTLSEQQREIIVLRYMLGWKVKQIAAHLGMAENTVSVTLRRIIQQLQTKVQEQQKEDRA
ncbi:MAG: RNA polymerase sigma factor [Anaerolineae bacterium]|nr:MAG: RNA polymerase sigma factor [Anaerolineae bacterium]